MQDHGIEMLRCLSVSWYVVIDSTVVNGNLLLVEMPSGATSSYSKKGDIHGYRKSRMTNFCNVCCLKESVGSCFMLLKLQYSWKLEQHS